MAGKGAVEKTGIWSHISFADGEKLNKLSTLYVSKVNEYRANPCPETVKARDDADKLFTDAWTVVYNRMNPAAQEAAAQTQPSKRGK